MTRVSDLDSEALEGAQRAIHDRILNGPRGVVEGPLRVWLTSPELADRAEALGAFCRFGTSLSARLSELAIIITGAHWRAGFEWNVHAPLAMAAGLSAEVVEAIRCRNAPRFVHADEAAVYKFCCELLEQHAVTDETYGSLAMHLPEKGIVELVGVLGYYAFISMTIRAFQVPLPAGTADPFPNLQ